MHEVNTRWGTVKVRYMRTEGAVEYLAVACPASLPDWCANKQGPPPMLLPRDLSVTGDWDKHLTMALAADIEDDKMRYVPPPKPPPPRHPVEQRTGETKRYQPK